MTHATTFLQAYDQNQKLALVSSSHPGFDMQSAYALSGDITALRVARGERLRGRKIGFTNRSIWPIYNVDSPIWGPVWDNTLTVLAPGAQAHLSAAEFNKFAEPRLEPEIVFGLKASPASARVDDLITAIDWVAHGYEVVQSHYPEWKFTAPDAVASFALHARLFVGARVAWREAEASKSDAQWQDELAQLELALYCNQQLIAKGKGRAVLDSPLLALGYLVQTLQDQGMPPLSPGEVITTGTLTDAQPLKLGQHWHTELAGTQLSGLALTIGAANQP